MRNYTYKSYLYTSFIDSFSMSNKHQGKYHLLVIFLVPALIFSFTFIENKAIWFLLLGIALIIGFLVFRKR